MGAIEGVTRGLARVVLSGRFFVSLKGDTVAAKSRVEDDGACRTRCEKQKKKGK